MKKYKLIVLLSIITVYLMSLNFIDANVKQFDLRFYNGKDNGLFSYFEVSILTVIFLYIDLFRNILLAIVLGLLYGIISIVIIYLTYNTDDFFKLFIIYLIFSFLPIYILSFIRNGSYLNLEFKAANILIVVIYILFLEIILKFSMQSSLLELIGN